jgi:hypothetical protein
MEVNSRELDDGAAVAGFQPEERGRSNRFAVDHFDDKPALEKNQ